MALFAQVIILGTIQKQPLQLSTQRIFRTHKVIIFGRPRLVPLIVMVRGFSISTASVQAAAVRTTSIMFDWLELLRSIS